MKNLGQLFSPTRLLGLSLAFAISACGGGGGSSGTVVGPTPGPEQSAASKIVVTATPATLQSGGGTVALTATVTNAAGAALAAKPVTFVANANGALQNPPSVTDANGVATTSLGVGSDRSNRTITVTVTSGTVSGVIDVQVVGTKLEFVSAPSSVPLSGGGTTFTVRARDSAGAPIAGAELSTSSSLGNITGSATTTTDAAGFAQISYVPTRSGVDTLTVVGLGTNVQTQVTVTGASKIDLTASADSVPTAGGTVTITAVVKSETNTAIVGQPVVFAASSGALVQAQAVTDASGAATVRLSAGADRSNRTIVVTATAGAARGLLNVPANGTRIFLSGSGSLLSSAGPTNYSVRAQDSAGAPIGGAVIAVQSALGNSLGTTTVTTDSTGFAQFAYQPTRQGIDNLTITGLGTSAQLSVSVSGQDFAFVSNGVASFTTGTNQTVQVRLRNGSTGVAGRTIKFSSTRGTVSPGTAVTDAEGIASVVVSSTTAGPVTLTAESDTGVAATLTGEFVAVTPATIAVQASPTAVLPNAPGSTTNRATVVAVVRDPIGNPVKNAAVNFSAVDPSGGSISPPTATTDSNGQAVSSFIPGAASTGSSAVVIRATVASNTAITSTTNLTVSGQALFISIGTGNELLVVNTTTYSKPFTVYVTDSNGSAVRSQTVVLSLYPDTYTKGRYVAVDGKWVATPAVTCPNEDVNRDGILSQGEDTNGNGTLTPGGVAVISPTTVTTDASGFASFNVLYGKQFGSWVDTTIRASALVAGTESSSTYRFGLSVLAADVASTDVSPPGGVNSPFGVFTSCTSPL